MNTAAGREHQERRRAPGDVLGAQRAAASTSTATAVVRPTQRDHHGTGGQVAAEPDA